MNKKYRPRFRLRGHVAPMNSERWKCSWLNCAHGMGLAGLGRCSARGEWWNKDCLDYESTDEFEKRYRETWNTRGDNGNI